MAKIIILSGAGISAESGISTFRDEDGLWENHDIADICTSGCLNFNRENTIKTLSVTQVIIIKNKGTIRYCDLVNAQDFSTSFISI